MSSNWGFFIFFALLLIAFSLADLSDEVKKQSMTESEKVALQQEKQQEKAAKELQAQERAKHKEWLNSLSFKDVPTDLKPEWILQRLFTSMPLLASLVIIGLIVAGYRYISKTRY